MHLCHQQRSCRGRAKGIARERPASRRCRVGEHGASATTSPSRESQAAITGKTPDGEPIKGDYKFTDEFPMADGFEENAEFFTLTYETPVAVSHNRAFARIAPLLWLRAGSEGAASTSCPTQGWEVADAYGLLVDLDKATPFSKQ